MLVEDVGYYIADSEEIMGFAPCPFCGGTNQEVYETGILYGKPSNRHKFRVICDCGTSLDASCQVYPYDNTGAAIAEAARKTWNRRA